MWSTTSASGACCRRSKKAVAFNYKHHEYAPRMQKYPDTGKENSDQVEVFQRKSCVFVACTWYSEGS